MSLDVTFTDNSGEFLQALEENTDKTLEMLGLQASGYAALELENDPRRIDTGLLRNSITYAIAGKKPAKTEYTADKGDGKGKYQGIMPKMAGERTVYIGTNVKYAPYVHEGHYTTTGKKITANRFLKNAVEKHKEEYKRMLEMGLKGEL